MNPLHAWLNQLRRRYGERRVNWLGILLLIGIGSVSVHLLVRNELDSSALLYVGLPYLGALAIVVVRPPKSDARWWHAYRDVTLTSLIVLLASSIVLFEGFVCVVMFLPIYLLVVSIAFVGGWWSNRGRGRGGRTLGVLLPVMALSSSFEGTTETLSAERTAQVEVSRTVALPPQQIMANLLLPIDLDVDRGWLLSVFPMPYRVDAESLDRGAVHRMHTRYHRWFVMNTHEGEVHLEIVDYEPDHRLRTRVVHDTSFFATYLTQLGSDLTLTRTAPDETEIRLCLAYRRNLDPAWYFHPLQQFAMREMASFFIDEVLVRARSAQDVRSSLGMSAGLPTTTGSDASSA